MDSIDSYWQQSESDELLKRHGPDLAAEACMVLSGDASARVAGMITTPDSRDATALRAALEQASGQAVPSGLMVGLVPRVAVDPLLAAYVGNCRWKEEPWQRQQVLPVVVATRDGYRFGFFRLDAETGATSHSL